MNKFLQFCLALTVILTSLPIYAVVGNTYSATNCKTYDNSTNILRTWGVIAPTPNTSIGVECNITRPTLNFSNFDVSVFVYDGNTTKNVSCNLVNEVNFHYYSDYATSTKENFNTIQLSLKGVSSQPESNLVLLCQLPAHTTLNGYYVKSY